ncbi:DinB family protein [Bosea vestrisii]|uniref:DinB family protein n=1 Tax=Bosea vestrisii TaxID=151416 RepID=A0ABW0HE25_9HYPH
MSEMLQILYGYQAWANHDLLDKLALLDDRARAAERETALRLVNHHHVVARIFAAHLTGADHGYTSDNTAETPSLDQLRAAVAATDRWYQDFVRTASPEMLSEAVAFSFTDGDKGCMTRQEMLLHVALHSAVHRGEVCRILWQLSITPPWDTLAVYLHQSEPARRLQSAAA